jgi:hypothetical protein
MRKLKEGTQLIARETLYMDDEDEEICLKKDKVYPIRRFDKDCAIIDSEVCKGHYWPIDEVYLNFIVPNIELSKQIKVL